MRGRPAAVAAAPEFNGDETHVPGFVTQDHVRHKKYWGNVDAPFGGEIAVLKHVFFFLFL